MTTFIEGKLHKDRLRWSDLNYQYVDRINVGRYVEFRIKEIPNGAYIKISIEVLDDDPT